ncbi:MULTISPECIES: hypothetical protein [unclassified Caballeronia]|uniref:hypothetical protein n=1 Tax=unclassified Caballeronia TaxID=2646786 RepID=UPI0013ED8D39|nr:MULTISPECIES: hypothetical protein [unclassified Caballeronia]
MPGLIDKYLASAGYTGQLTDAPLAADPPANLFELVASNYGAHGPFDSESKRGSWDMFTDRHRTAFWTVAALGLIGGVHLLGRPQKRSATPISYKVSQCPKKLLTNNFSLKNV